MAQSLSNVVVHLIFGTKGREPWIRSGVEGDLHRYIAGACRACRCPAHTVGGALDHVHLLCSLARTATVSQLVEDVKTASSKWMKEHGRKRFAWQGGYAAFSVSPSQVPTVSRYVERQALHHRRRSFQDELRAILLKCHVAFDEKYLWD